MWRVRDEGFRTGVHRVRGRRRRSGARRGAGLRRGAGQPEIAGLPTAGPLTDWGLPLARFAHDLCAVACVGTLLAAAVLAPATSPESARCLRAARGWALGWAFATLLSYVLTLSSFIPMPVAGLLAAPDMLAFGTELPQTRALLLVLAVTFVSAAATVLPKVPRWVPLAVAAFGLLPPAYVGHAASAGTTISPSPR
ncbi:hypothetical protein ACFQQB_45310 [Nonomuraea rubra]|uniref:hypothetical protein n=1 Tax=Nonomuraea rubra TaxID=46180 RepID=UPI003622DC46